MKHKITLFTLSFLLSVSALMAESWNAVQQAVPSPSRPVVVSSDIHHSRIRLDLSGYYLQQVVTPAGPAVVVKSPGGVQLLEKGLPDLPQFTTSVIIPDGADMEVVLVNSKYQDIQNVSIAPSKGNLYRNVLPAEVPYAYADAYSENAFWPSAPMGLRSPYILRDLRGQTVIFRPFSYNPVTKTLRVYSQLEVEVREVKTSGGTNELVRSKSFKSADPNFLSLYKGHFSNFPSLLYVPVEETPKLLVICPSQWMPFMQPLVEWKKRRGVSTEMVDVLAAGGTASGIQAYIANQYLTNGIGYVLLVGDAAQVPTLTAQGGASDPSYGYVSGNDSYAEVIIGRFSAESDADVQTQVQRVLDYELYADTSMHHFSNGVAIGSNQGPGDDGEMDWEHEQNIRTDLLNFTYTTVSELYDGTHPGTTDLPGDPSHTDLFNLFQSGIGVMTYTGHGSNQSCGTTGLSTNDIALMTNTGMLPFVWSVACVNGEFSAPGSPCFAEKFLRAQSNGKPAGAVATFMSSINQSWNPPMDAQDEMVDLLIQSVPSNVKYTFGGMSVNGCLHMNDNYGQAGAEMTDTWHCFGDPTLNVRTATPQLMSVSHPPTLNIGLGNVIVNGSFDGATVALTMNGDILATGTVSGGVASLNFSPLVAPDTIYVTVTGFNQVTYSGSILVIPASGPYVIYQTGVCNDPSGNNNGLIDFSEPIDVDLTVQNVGMADAINVTADLATADPYITINAATANMGTVAMGSTASLSKAFNFTVANNVPDQHLVQFMVTATDQSGTSWNSSFFQTIQAPALNGGGMLINDATGGDGDGVLEPGESALITLRCENNGHSDAPSAQASITTISPYLTLMTNSVSLGTIASQNYLDATFQVSLSPNVTVGTAWDITLSLGSGAYQISKLYGGSAGLILEDFETANLAKFNWQSGGTGSWFVTNSAPFEGLYCAQSGPINDDEQVDLSLAVTCITDDSLSFWYKVSSEQDYDFLIWSIDGTTMDSWSGISPGWAYTGTLLTAGVHLVTFTYQKDLSYASGSDCAWLDNIRLPFGAQTTAVENISGNDSWSVWPNPASQLLNLMWKDGQNAADVQWTLMSVDGKVAERGSMNVAPVMQVNTAALANGFYLLTLQCNGKTSAVKVQIQH